MNQLWKSFYELGAHWILAFFIVAVLTVSTCVKQQQTLLHASFSKHTVVAMKHSGRVVQ